MEFVIEKRAMLTRKSGKIETTEEIELPYQERIRTLLKHWKQTPERLITVATNNKVT